MEQAPKTSFIPKQAVGIPQARERRSFNVVTFIAMVVFLAVLVLSIAVFFYKNYAETNLETEKSKLAEFKQHFASSASDDIREIRLLDDRLGIAEDMLNRHVSLTRLFAALEERVQTNAQLLSFSYERRPSGDAQISIDGRATTFNTVALQERGFLADPVFVLDTVAFTEVDVAVESGGEDDALKDDFVTFSVAADIDTSEIAYRGVTIDAASTTEDKEEETGTTTESSVETDEVGTTTPQN